MCQEGNVVGWSSDLPGMLQSPTAKREPRLQGVLRRFGDRLIVVGWTGLAAEHDIAL